MISIDHELFSILFKRKLIVLEMQNITKSIRTSSNHQQLLYLFDRYKNIRSQVIEKHGLEFWTLVIRPEVLSKQFPYHLRK